MSMSSSTPGPQTEMAGEAGDIALQETQPQQPVTGTPGVLSGFGGVLWRIFTMNRKASVGISIVLFFVIVALIGPIFLRTDPSELTNDILVSPNSAHWLGTTLTGQDIFSQLIAGTRVSILWGFATGLGAKVACPQSDVLVVSGDGGFMFTVQELATAVQFRIPIVVLLVNDGGFGNVRRTQIEEFEGRTIASDLTNPDFVRLAESFGARGIRVAVALRISGPEGFRPARAKQSHFDTLPWPRPVVSYATKMTKRPAAQAEARRRRCGSRHTG